MPTYHVVQQGECLSSIARRYHFSNYRQIYDHPLNAEFKRQRPNPNIIYPGDRIAIPDKRPKEVQKPAGQSHKFRVTVSRALLRIAVHDDYDQPCAGRRYQLDVQGTVYQGQTNAQGLIEQSIDAQAQSGKLTIWPGDPPGEEQFVFQLSIGHLDPVNENTGVQARLNNLGFDCGEVDGIVGPKTRAAIERYQAYRGMEPTGELDRATRDKLRSDHDGD